MALRDATEMIAERKLICQRANGERVLVTLRIGKPYPASDVDWACSAEAEGLFDRLADMHGVDSFQALILAQGLLRNLLSAEIEKGSTLHWRESGERMSLEDLFGKAI
jgi:hypothetical protein